VSDQLDLDRTLFVFASKSGRRIETHALLLYFLNRLRIHKAAEPGRCFCGGYGGRIISLRVGEELRLPRDVSRPAGEQRAIFIAHSLRIVMVRSLATGLAGVGDAGEVDSRIVQARPGRRKSSGGTCCVLGGSRDKWHLQMALADLDFRWKCVASLQCACISHKVWSKGWPKSSRLS
jgi:hypothetical protein